MYELKFVFTNQTYYTLQFSLFQYFVFYTQDFIKVQ